MLKEGGEVEHLSVSPSDSQTFADKTQKTRHGIKRIITTCVIRGVSLSQSCYRIFILVHESMNDVEKHSTDRFLQFQEFKENLQGTK